MEALGCLGRWNHTVPIGVRPPPGNTGHGSWITAEPVVGYDLLAVNRRFIPAPVAVWIMRFLVFQRWLVPLDSARCTSGLARLADVFHIILDFSIGIKSSEWIGHHHRNHKRTEPEAHEHVTRCCPWWNDEIQCIATGYQWDIEEYILVRSCPVIIVLKVSPGIQVTPYGRGHDNLGQRSRDER